MKKLYNLLKVKLCYKTYWKQWLAFLTLLLVIILASEYADYTTKRVLEYDRKKAVERLNLAKEKDSTENNKVNKPSI
tara:strand:+ start:2003 stop:2233 length:231 start_codon:yes stop_codon:yes gene_type:complete